MQRGRKLRRISLSLLFSDNKETRLGSLTSQLLDHSHHHHCKQRLFGEMRMWGFISRSFFVPDFNHHFFLTCTIAVSPPLGPIPPVSPRLFIKTAFTLLPSPTLRHPLPLHLNSYACLAFLVECSAP